MRLNPLLGSMSPHSMSGVKERQKSRLEINQKDNKKMNKADQIHRFRFNLTLYSLFTRRIEVK